MRTINCSTSLSIRGRPGARRAFDPSNLRAMSLRYHARMVSGRAVAATSPRAFRPSRCPISPSFVRSTSESLHGQCRQATSDGVVLVRSRRAKECHHAVALRLGDYTVVTMNGVLHEIEHGLETPHAQFGIAQAVNQACRIPDIGKEQREVFAFSALVA